MTPYIVLALLLLRSCSLNRRVASRTFSFTPIFRSRCWEVLARRFCPGTDVLIPLATLAGIIIGYSRMGSDSEIVAIARPGVGSWTMIWPALLIGLMRRVTTLHLKEAPEATRDLERIALEGALAKLDSPVEPRTFSTLPRYVIYVRDGDKALRTWGRVFIFAQGTDRANPVHTRRVPAR